MILLRLRFLLLMLLLLQNERFLDLYSGLHDLQVMLPLGLSDDLHLLRLLLLYDLHMMLSVRLLHDLNLRLLLLLLLHHLRLLLDNVHSGLRLSSGADDLNVLLLRLLVLLLRLLLRLLNHLYTVDAKYFCQIHVQASRSPCPFENMASSRKE